MFLSSLVLGVFPFVVQEPGQAEPQGLDVGEHEPTREELDALFAWRQGEILLGNGMAKLHLPADFRYLSPGDAKRVLEDVWGNPPGNPTWGMVFPNDFGPFDEGGWAVVLEYEDDGHVSDDDANEIDYDELLESMQDEARESNPARIEAGFGSLEIVGWAARPHYEATTHRLYWAKEIQFEDAPSTTLNYDVRVLGRKGVLSMNAVAGMEHLVEVEEGMKALLGAVEFGKGNRYEDFDSNVDKLAAYGIGGLIAGKLALKAGLFKGLIALLVAGKKLVIAGLVAVAALFRRVFKGKKEEAQPAE